MDRLANMITLVTVAETGSFVETANRLNLANSVISKRIKDLEDYLGTRLLQRTTRHLNLTEAGYVYVEHARKFLDELAEVEENLRYANENPVGDIKISAPLSFGNKFLGPAVSSFLDKYPDVTVRLIVNDRIVDIAEEGFDL
ncbi:MAG: LysR family transcriptional regulator, partial [Proteobacteria bacterium]|nr:LysR family transcriptional regulator [Pseudomonadota bacterium]